MSFQTGILRVGTLDEDPKNVERAVEEWALAFMREADKRARLLAAWGEKRDGDALRPVALEYIRALNGLRNAEVALGHLFMGMRFYITPPDLAR